MRMQPPSLLASFCRLLLANTLKLKSKPARSLVLLGLIAVATTAVASSTASAGSLEKFFASISRTVGVSFSEPKASSISPRVNAAPNAVSLAPNVPQGISSSLLTERRGHTATRLPDGRVPQTDEERAIAIFWRWEQRKLVTTEWVVGPYRGLLAKNPDGWTQTLITLAMVLLVFNVILSHWAPPPPPASPEASKKNIFRKVFSTPLWHYLPRRPKVRP